MVERMVKLLQKAAMEFRRDAVVSDDVRQKCVQPLASLGRARLARSIKRTIRGVRNKTRQLNTVYILWQRARSNCRRTRRKTRGLQVMTCNVSVGSDQSAMRVRVQLPCALPV